MFDLENEVDRWSREFAGTACGRTDRVEELKDHILCEIEKNVKEGLSEESAFLAATRRFGISEDLKAEFRKGRSIPSLFCDIESNTQWLNLTTKQLALSTGIYLVLFAGLTFGLVYLLRGTDLFLYFLPIIYVFSLIPLAFSAKFRKKGREECAFIMRKLGFGK